MSELSHKPKSLSIHLVHLSGNPSLLGAGEVTWRLGSGGLNIVGGGNGSGKSLFCSAIKVAMFPEQTEMLQRGLFTAGLSNVTVVGQLGDVRQEWTIDLEHGAIARRPLPHDELLVAVSPVEEIAQAQGENLPHVVINGEWLLPKQAQIDWAARMSLTPLEHELSAWETRLDALEHGEGESHPESLQAELAQIDLQIAHSRSLLEELQQAELQVVELETQVTEARQSIQIASAEETELVAKIEIAERCVHLESWATELRLSWDSVEFTRTQFAQMHERLESLQDMTRGLPDNAGELAQDYLRLIAERETIALRLKENEQKAALLANKRIEILAEQSKLALATHAGVDSGILKLQANVEEIERELTALSRHRIDLLRKRDGLEHQRAEKYRELINLGPEEWQSLDQLLESNNLGESTQGLMLERDRQQKELARIVERLSREFSGFEKLSADTPMKIEKLFATREAVTARESEMSLLRNKIVELQSSLSYTGRNSFLALIGAVAAGVSTGAFLGWDVGFFAAVLGGGAGYSIGNFLTSRPAGNRDELVRKIESLQHEQQVALSARESLRLELSVIAEQPTIDGALNRWQDYVKLHDRKQALEDICSRPVVTDERMKHVPTALRKLELEDIRKRVSEYRNLTAQLTDAAVELGSFEQAKGQNGRKAELETIIMRQREEIAELETRETLIIQDRELQRVALAAELAQVEAEQNLIPNIDADRLKLRDILSMMESLDDEVGHAFSRCGAETIQQAIYDRNGLQSDLREAKTRLSSEHSPQELGVRTGLIEDELRQVTERLHELDPLFATFGSRQDGLDKYKLQLERLYVQSKENEKIIERLQIDITQIDLSEILRRFSELPPEQEFIARRGVAQSRLDEIQGSVRAAHDMCEALTAEIAEQREHAIARVHSILQSEVFLAIGERFATVEYKDGIWHVVTEDGLRRPIATLSRGIAELVTLCLNVGLLMASSEGELAPIFWDDVLSQLDDYHLSIARKVIEHAARDRQIVLLTRDPRMRVWGTLVEVQAGRQHLDALVN